ncbi:MAG: hypothetical protein ABSA75_10945 [Candidatus Bathyarchaeia archaeon]|jgi:hypothetical protein
MKNKIILTIFILTALSILSISVASAQSPQLASLGVTQGDVLQYNYNVNWSSTDPTLPVPSDVIELNQTQSFQITITSISGTTINAEVISTYRNGSTNTQTGFVDVDSGSIHLPYGDLIIAGNLNVNDKIYPNGGDATINYTAVRTYPSGNRQTNEQLVETTSENHYDKTDVYYDKIKGVAVSSYYESIDTFGSETETFTETITSTNADVWAVGSAPTSTATRISPTPTTRTPTATTAAFVFSAADWLIVIAVVMILLILVILTLFRRRRKPQTQETQKSYMGTF